MSFQYVPSQFRIPEVPNWTPPAGFWCGLKEDANTYAFYCSNWGGYVMTKDYLCYSLKIDSSELHPVYSSINGYIYWEGNGYVYYSQTYGWIWSNLFPGWSAAVTEVTHNHPEGLKGAEVTAMSVFLLRNGCSKDEQKLRIEEEYGYDPSCTLDSIRPSYTFDVTCQGSVPPAIIAFLESSDFEDAIRNAVSIGGDPDTLAAITGALAHAYYGIPENVAKLARGYLDLRQTQVLDSFLMLCAK